MPIIIKKDILSELKKAGYSSYMLRQNKLMGEQALQRIRAGELPSWKNLGIICKLLNCQPGDLLGYVADDSGT